MSRTQSRLDRLMARHRETGRRLVIATTARRFNLDPVALCRETDRIADRLAEADDWTLADELRLIATETGAPLAEVEAHHARILAEVA